MKTKVKSAFISAAIGAVIGSILAIPTMIPEKVEGQEEVRIYLDEPVKHIEIDEPEVDVEELRDVTLLACNKPERTYTEEEVELLAHLIMAETGSDWLPDEMLYLTGSVVLNRVACDQFPNTIAEVIYQEGQYTSAVDYVEPTQRCYRIARDLLEGGSVIPENVVYQAEFEQGSGVYAKIENTYYCEL